MSGSDVVRSRLPRRGAARWREICEEYDRFMGTRAGFCRLHCITCGSLRCWRLKREAAFVEVAAPETAVRDVELAFDDGTALRLRKP